MSTATYSNIVPVSQLHPTSEAAQELSVVARWDPRSGLTFSIPSEALDRVRSFISPVTQPLGFDGSSPWLTLVEAARYAGYECRNGRAPNSMYDLAREIGRQVKGRWVINVDDLDRAIRDGLLT